MFTSAERIETHSDRPYRIYEVALSFAGEDRAYVKRVANALREMKLRVFYDEYENVTLWGKDLYVHLDEIYSKHAKYCVAFLSEHYKRKLWTNHERESAQARAFEERSEYILPVKLDETEIPGVRKTVGYIGKLPPKRLAKLIFEKVRRG
ncbi:MAG: TIR domain-containing protein [Gammaproteobacteria bacterium]|nr:TIR domain-containing protein [Gammaproteobacteria bacterium]MBU2058570.1 TIR domain-containing protein [Gammaproteobacteria bacterium]MBU2173522.1 TIR domain-containing protein [Gammaproteobacteria bacterium]MBU2246476.1 TIR domain-containing protein [Gammaproteobacteria bacterium]MBU2344824.1 TIR domain-containing protein [Gammaproteobacteria bacterium]